jgi:hypothetical protein
MKLVKWADRLPMIVKLLLLFFTWSIFWSLYRLIRAGHKGGILAILISILSFILFSWWLLFIIDLFTIIISNKVWWIW